MATFTKISDTEQPVISVNPAHKISRIDDNTYGGFTECVPTSVEIGILLGSEMLTELAGTWAAVFTADSTTQAAHCQMRMDIARASSRPSRS